MIATRFMRKPFIVTGYKVTEEDMDAIARWCEGHVIRDTERPFVRVPVDRPTNKKQTEAYIGTWVLLSTERPEKSFKVYTQTWLNKNFIEVPAEIDDEIVDEIHEEDDDTHHRISDNVRTLPTHVPKPVKFRAAT